MAIYLDSASPSELRQALDLGFVAGVTTNPELLARSDQSAESVVPELCDLLGEGLVFYQLTGTSVEERERVAHHVTGLRPGRVGLKIPCTTENLALVPRLAAEGLVCAVTAVFSGYQALLACSVWAHYVIPYVNRATRQLGDGPALVREIRDVIDGRRVASQILAESFRSLPEIVDAARVGADHVTIPLGLLRAMGDHPLSERAIAEFAQLT